jgi:hypothetical protein
MRRIVLPVASANTADATHSTNAANSAGTTYTTHSTDATCSSRTTNTADAANTTGTTDSTYSTNTTDTTDSTYAANTTYAANATHTANATCSAAAQVSVPGEVVIVVYIDRVVTAPSAAITPTSTPEGAHGDANAKRDRQSGGIISRIVNWRIGIVRSHAPYIDGVIRWHVNDLRIGLFDYDYTLLLNDPCFYLDLLVGG